MFNDEAVFGDVVVPVCGLVEIQEHNRRQGDDDEYFMPVLAIHLVIAVNGCKINRITTDSGNSLRDLRFFYSVSIQASALMLLLMLCNAASASRILGYEL